MALTRLRGAFGAVYGAFPIGKAVLPACADDDDTDFRAARDGLDFQTAAVGKESGSGITEREGGLIHDAAGAPPASKAGRFAVVAGKTRERFRKGGLAY